MTLEEALRLTLDSFSGPFYVAGNETQRRKACERAADYLAKILANHPEALTPFSSTSAEKGDTAQKPASA